VLDGEALAAGAKGDVVARGEAQRLRAAAHAQSHQGVFAGKGKPAAAVTGQGARQTFFSFFDAHSIPPLRRTRANHVPILATVRIETAAKGAKMQE
jgi:hypothetical protein